MKHAGRNNIFNIRSLIEKYDEPVFRLHREVYKRLGIRPKLVSLLTCSDPGSLSYIKGMRRFSGVWFATGTEVAEAWVAAHGRRAS